MGLRRDPADRKYAAAETARQTAEAARSPTLRMRSLDVFCGPLAPLSRAAERAGWSAECIDIQLGDEFDLTQADVARRLEVRVRRGD